MNNIVNKNVIYDDKFIEELILNQKKFDNFVYTPMDEAVKEINLRQNDKKLNERIKAHLIKIPSVMEGKPKVVLFRNIATSNYETKWFVDVVTTLENFEPLFLEYTQDKFTNKNECKFALGKLLIFKGKNKKNEPIFEHKNIIDINNSNCKPILSIKTLWNQRLVDFHHELFLDDFSHFKNNIYDFSDWVQKNGHTAKEYYKL